jgi:ABC-2 type transport system permease protein
MSTLNMAEEMGIAIAEPAAVNQHPTRPFLWSVRRELWENLSIVVAPLAVVATSELGFAIGAIRHGKQFFTFAATQNGSSQALVAVPFLFIAIGIVLTMLLVAVFYSLDALYGERRDRSIFFWKSLPVSDLTTVASKIAVPLLVVPVVTLAFILAAHLLLLLIGAITALFAGAPALKLLWTQVPFLKIWIALTYAVVAMTLWYAPVYAWLLFVSAWARRAALVWAVLPFFLLALLEKIAFNTRYIVELVKYRFAGEFPLAFAVDPHSRQAALELSTLTPGRFLMSAGLWAGLLFAAVLFVIMVRMRRYREPI